MIDNINNLNLKDVKSIFNGWNEDLDCSLSIYKNTYIDPTFFSLEKKEIFQKSWQFFCLEKLLAEPGLKKNFSK